MSSLNLFRVPPDAAGTSGLFYAAKQNFRSYGKKQKPASNSAEIPMKACGFRAVSE